MDDQRRYRVQTARKGMWRSEPHVHLCINEAKRDAQSLHFEYGRCKVRVIELLGDTWDVVDGVGGDE